MSIDVNDHFVALQTAILGRLTETDAAVPAPTPANGIAVPYLSEVLDDIEMALTAKLNSLGIGVVVQTPLGNLIGGKDSQALAIDSPVMIEIQENVTINRGSNGTQIPALRLVSFIMKRLHWWPHMIYPGGENPQRIKLDAVPFIRIPDQSSLTYAISAHAPINLNAPLRANA